MSRLILVPDFLTETKNGYRLIFMKSDTRPTCFHPLVPKYLSLVILIRHFLDALYEIFPVAFRLKYHLQSAFFASFSFIYTVIICFVKLFHESIS